jgi:hypothetical protein
MNSENPRAGLKKLFKKDKEEGANSRLMVRHYERREKSN